MKWGVGLRLAELGSSAAGETPAAEAAAWPNENSAAMETQAAATAWPSGNSAGVQTAVRARAVPQRVPVMKLHRPSGRAYVRLGGRQVYLGAWGSGAAQGAYDRLVAEWLAGGRRLGVDVEVVTVVELAAAFWAWAVEYYRGPDGEPTGTAENFRAGLRLLRELYGESAADAFGPMALKAVRQRMIELGWSRGHINDEINRVRRVFRWGVENELVRGAVLQGLDAVAPLKRGRSEAREGTPVSPVSMSDIEAIRPWVSRQVWAMVQVQLLSGCRPGEVLVLRPRDVDTSGRIWTAQLGEHKTAWRGRERVIYFGPKAQGILREFLVRPADAFLFSPREAEAERYAAAAGHRRADQRRNAAKTRRTVGERYTVGSYRVAIARACESVGIEAWAPNRLRHTAATEIRREWGLEAAQVMLGHARADVTQVYAEANRARALEVAAGR